MVKRETIQKAVGVGIAFLLVALIFLVLIPPATAVYVSAGTPDDRTVTKTNTITFEDVNLTIRNAEKIPVNNLTFTVYKNSDDSVQAYVIFYINGTEIDDHPSGKFTVTNTTVIDDDWYGYGYDTYGYDERTGWNESTYTGYGYGYNGTSTGDITFLYDIVYTTHKIGTFYAKLTVNSTSHDYVSDETVTFTVSAASGGGGDDDDGGGGTVIEPPGPETTTTSQDTLDDVESQFGVTLEDPFYATDSDGDGLVDEFYDPNGVLSNVRGFTMGENQTFLISTDGDDKPEFFWNSNSDTVTPVSSQTGEVADSYIDEVEETVTIVVNVDKTDYIYIDVTDQYPPEDFPDYTLVVKTSDGRVISSDMIWREDGNIYVLDDPDTQYVFVYYYDILPPQFDPPSGTTFDASFTPPDGTEFSVKRPSIEITYQEDVTLITATLNSAVVIDDVTTTDQRTFNFTPTSDLADGTYTFSITVEDADGNQRTDTATYTVDTGEEPTQPLPWTLIIAVIVVIIIILLVVFWLFKSGRLYFEEVDTKKKK